MLTLLAAVLAGYGVPTLALAITFAIIERVEQIPPDRLHRWRADARVFTFGWPIAVILVPMIFVFDWAARRR